MISLCFGGPFAWLEDHSTPCIWTAPEARKAGIYLWTVAIEGGHLVYYVGESGSTFGRRMLQHLQEQLGGTYHIHEPESFASGVKRPLWHGMYGKTREPGGLSEFVRRLPDLAPALARFVRLMRFHVAPLECDRRLRRRIEAGLALHFYGVPGIVGQFQETNIRYVPRRREETPIEISCEAEVAVIALPSRLTI